MMQRKKAWFIILAIKNGYQTSDEIWEYISSNFTPCPAPHYVRILLDLLRKNGYTTAVKRDGRNYRSLTKDIPSMNDLKRISPVKKEIIKM